MLGPQCSGVQRPVPGPEGASQSSVISGIVKAGGDTKLLSPFLVKVRRVVRTGKDENVPFSWKSGYSAFRNTLP